MKKLLALLMAALLLVPAAGLSEAALTRIPGTLSRPEIPVKAAYPDNAIPEGISSTTGLPFTGVYAPVIIVVDNAPDAHPHWGVGQADVIYQVPNAGGGATKLMALFADSAPQYAGGCRSARTVFADVAYGWGAAFAFAGTPGEGVVKNANVPERFRELGYRGSGLTFNLLGNNTVSHRVKWTTSPHNLSVHVAEIRDKVIADGKTFTPRAFLFADALPAAGVPANFVEIDHQGNPASHSTFTYDVVSNSYTRANSSGPYVDRDNPGTPISFANVLIQRVKMTTLTGGYVSIKNFVGTGTAEIFTGGRYIAGAWSKAANEARTVFVDEQGNEVALQRGKTFVIITNDQTTVDYR
jgi:hypothetical protein